MTELSADIYKCRQFATARWERRPFFDGQYVTVFSAPGLCYQWIETNAGVFEREYMTDQAAVRIFETGATRDTENGKYAYARFLDPLVLRAFAAYMHKHRQQSDGSVREPDNWKRGIPLQTYMDGLWRHLQDVWEIHDYGEAIRPETGEPVDIEDALCAVMFNAMGYLHVLQTRERAPVASVPK